MSGVWEEREYVSRYGAHTTGLVIHQNGVPTDADGAVTVDLLHAEDDSVVWSGHSASHVATGTYEITLNSGDTATPDAYDLRWHFVLATVTPNPLPRTFIEVGEAAPAYDGLDSDMQDVVNNAYHRFADLFDSPYGGPHLQVYFQTKFGRQRLAQLLHDAVGRLNTVAQPYQTYTIVEPGRFPIQKWGSLLEQALYVETLKHLVRSYVELPDWQGIPGARADRRDYMSRWQTVLESEKEDLERALEVFKIANMGLGRAKVLVGGGVYGRYGPTRIVGSAASRPRYWARFY